MARTWCWHCGWEASFPYRIAPLIPAFIQYARTAMGQDFWTLGGVNPNPLTPGRTGKYCVNIAPLGAGVATNFVGQYVVRTNDWVFWHVPFRLNAWGVPGNLQAADDYVYARCTNVFAAGIGANQYFGIGFQAAPAPPTDIVPAVHLFNGNTGAIFAPNVLAGGGPFTPPTGWITTTVAHEVATKNTYLYVNGALVAGPYVPAAVVQNDAPILPDNRFSGGGKGTDGVADLDTDDFGGAQGSAQADVPGVNNGVLLAQPNADVLTQWTPHGFGTHYYNWDAENQNVECAGCHYNDPTAIGQQEACDFAPLALAAPPPARVEAARFVWACSGAIGPGPSTHTPYGNIGGAAWQLLTGGVGREHTGPPPLPAPVHCFDGPAFWHGAQMEFTPEAVPVAWTMAAFNQLQGRLDATVAVNGGVEEFYAMAMVNAAARPMPTPNDCPVAEIVASRQIGGKQPYPAIPAMVPYHHH